MAHLLCPLLSCMPTTHPAHGGYDMSRDPKSSPHQGQVQAHTFSPLPPEAALGGIFMQGPTAAAHLSPRTGIPTSYQDPHAHRHPPFQPPSAGCPHTSAGDRPWVLQSSAPATRSSPTPVHCCPRWLHSHLGNQTNGPFWRRG